MWTHTLLRRGVHNTDSRKILGVVYVCMASTSMGMQCTYAMHPSYMGYLYTPKDKDNCQHEAAHKYMYPPRQTCSIQAWGYTNKAFPEKTRE